MTINSKDKGRRGEQELARKLREYGYTEAKRSVQYCGANGDADVIGLPGIHIECKRVERLQLYDAIDQAKRDCGENIPAVFHRKNNCEWLVIMRLEDWIEMYKEGTNENL
jgi:Holliday junction resolvase